MFKVTHIQFSAGSGGSAALKLHDIMEKNGIDSRIISLHSDVAQHKITLLGKMPKLISAIDRKLQSYVLRNRVKQYGMFSYPILGTDISKMEEIKRADFIYIHWALHGFLNFRSIRQLAEIGKPVIFVMHDMWPITGGCHHSFSCEKYKENCTGCPIFFEKENSPASVEFTRKLSLYAAYKNLYFVSPSRWLLDCAKKSKLTRHKPSFYIPNTIDEHNFKPGSKIAAKQALGIPVNETVISFGAVSVESPYKGWSYLQNALSLLPKDPNTTILIFGSGNDNRISKYIPFKIKSMGYVSNVKLLESVYRASDVFVVPSVADNLPYTIFEALSCGTPVVGFANGGPKEQIQHKYNGYLAQYKDSTDLAEGIKYCLEHKLPGRVLSEFASSAIIKKHLELLQHIYSQNNHELT